MPIRRRQNSRIYGGRVVHLRRSCRRERLRFPFSFGFAECFVCQEHKRKTRRRNIYRTDVSSLIAANGLDVLVSLNPPVRGKIVTKSLS